MGQSTSGCCAFHARINRFERRTRKLGSTGSFASAILIEGEGQFLCADSAVGAPCLKNVIRLLERNFVRTGMNVETSLQGRRMKRPGSRVSRIAMNQNVLAHRLACSWFRRDA